MRQNHQPSLVAVVMLPEGSACRGFHVRPARPGRARKLLFHHHCRKSMCEGSFVSLDCSVTVFVCRSGHTVDVATHCNPRYTGGHCHLPGLDQETTLRR
jgi:hypothetical protein